MTALAITLWLLGSIGCAASVTGDVTPSLRKGTICICWPLLVAVAIVYGLFNYARGR